MTAMERNPGSYNDTQDLVKYISLEEFVPNDTKNDVSKLLPDFSYRKVTKYDPNTIPDRDNFSGKNEKRQFEKNQLKNSTTDHIFLTMFLCST